MNYKITTAPAVKNTVTITRRQLWKNYVDSWSDIVRDEPGYLETIHLNQFQNVGNVLCGSEISVIKIRQLFRDGHTFMLMGDAIKYIDTDNDITLVEINVVEGDKTVVVHHEDINY